MPPYPDSPAGMHDHRLPPVSATERHALWVALALTASFAVVECVGGWLAGSLALLSDAGHMVTDVAALSIALFAQRLARRPPSQRASYGYARAEVLAAFSNALLMLAVVVWISVEAVRRLLAPTPVAGVAVISVASAGLVVNLVCAWLLSRGRSLNARAARVHVLGDLAGSIAALVAGAVVAATGWMPIDPLLSLFVAVLILRSTWLLLKASTSVLMEGVPAHLSYEDIGRALSRVKGVIAVHDLHVWQMSTERCALSAHVVIADPAAWPEMLGAAQRVLGQRFGIDHITLQPSWHSPPPGKRVIPLTAAARDKPGVR
jgi:cobalt-zinc-cadmium efflux system protein